MVQFTSRRIDNLFAHMKAKHLAIVGDLMLDRYIWGEVTRISPEAPVPVVALAGESSNLGGAANVAANVGSLGAAVTVFGIVGDDSHGEKLRDLVKSAGFSDDGLIVDPSRPTSVKTRVTSHGHHIVRIDDEHTRDVDDSIAVKVIDRIKSMLSGIDAVILEDYNKGVLSAKVIGEVIRICREAKVPIGIDPKWDNFWEYDGVTVLKPNLKELEAAVGHSVQSNDEVLSAARTVIDKLHPDHLLVTLGARGMALFSDGQTEFLPTRAHTVHDVSGAGDTVIATVMTALAAGADILEAASMANYAAGVVIAEVGAVPVNVEALKRACAE